MTLKHRKPLLAGIVAVACLSALALYVIFLANPQWHWRIYAFRAKNAENGRLDPPAGYSGVWNDWDPEGKLRSTYKYSNGRRDGPYRIYGDGDAVVSEGGYANGELDGVQTVLQDNGIRTEIPYANGKRHGMEISRFPSGRTAIEAPWENGEQQGIVTFYYESGARQSALPFYGGKLEGVHVSWYENGQIQAEESYRGGQKNGRRVFWTPAGKEEMALNYRDDRMDGLQMWFHPNGRKAREIILRNGVPEGGWREWNEGGELTVDDVYENGELKKDSASDNHLSSEP